MKRKLLSSEKGKGNQAITKFFKSLTPQGPKRSHTSVGNTEVMKTAKEEKFRTPILEKLQTSKTSVVAQDNSQMLGSVDNAKNDKEKSYLSEVKPLLNDESSPSVSGPDKVVCSYSQHASGQKMPLHSSPVTDMVSCKRALDRISSPSVPEDHAESSGMNCDETFYSACGDIDTTNNDTKYYSLTNVSCNSVQDESINTNTACSNGKVLDLNLGENKETDLPGCFNDTESISEEVCKEESSSHVHLNREQDCVLKEGELDQNIDQSSTTSLPIKDTESQDYFHEELKTNDVKEDQNSSSDYLMEGEKDNACDDFKEEECVKDCDQIDKPLNSNSALPEESESSNELNEAECNGSHGDLKKQKHVEDFDQIDKPFSDIYINRDSDDGALSEGSESSDEDLLTPPRFLYEKMQLQPNIRTPEKGIAPAYSTPSPITQDVEREEKTKYKLSFDKLIKEKVKRREKDAELAEMEAELQRGLEKGGVGQMHVPSTFSDIESEEELNDDGRDLKDCSLPKDIKKFLVDVHDFSEECPGEDIFPMFHPFVTSQEAPRLSLVPQPQSDTFEAKLLLASDSDLQELLCGGWILQHYLDRPCPSEITEWLFQIMCQHNDQHIVSSSFQVLWALVEAATENRDDLPKQPRGSSWVPSIKKVIKELLFFGSTIPILFPGDLVGQLNINDLLASEISSGEIQMEDITASGEPQTERFPVVNIMHLVQYLTHCLQKCPLSYIVQDLRNFVVLLCQLALDLRLQTVLFDIEMCLAAVLNCFGEMQWPDEIKELCSIVAKLSTNHRNLLHLVQIQPPSVQGIQLQRRLSMTLLHWLVSKFCRQQGTGKSPVDKRCDATIPDGVEVSSLVKLVEMIKPGEESDYFLLHTIISLVGFAVGSEDLSPKERGSLEQLTNKLRSLNGDIKDPRAAFMNRTKVKDLLVRTILRLAYMTQCIKPSKEHHITSYFECTSSDYQIELLKENEVESEMDSDEESTTADQGMDTTNSI